MEPGWWSPPPSPSPPPPPPRAPPCRCRPGPLLSTSYTALPRYNDIWADGEEESTVGALRERELRSLHRTVPALRRRELDTRAIKHHYYPEGGWGWIVCGAAFLAHLLSTGLQLAYGALLVHAIRQFETTSHHTVWPGSICMGVSRAAGALVAIKRQSPRLAALIGGLLLPLACLFTSFATQLHQTMLSYGVVLGIGCGLVRESAGLVLGAYFRRRRQFVELVAHAGGGVGVALFSVAYKEALGKLGWRLGLQAITGVLVMAFFLSATYRSASLYHPQRLAILHLKNQRRKIKEKKGLKKPPLFDLSCLRSQAAHVLLLSSAVAGFGLYAPVFYMASQGFEEGLEESALVLLQTFLGFAIVLGYAGFGLVLIRPSAQCVISRQYLCQISMFGLGVATLVLSNVEGYHGYVIFAWMYGFCLGGYMYSIKMLTMERIRGRHFTKVWGFVQGAEAFPIIVGVPVVGFINQQIPKAGYYFIMASILVGALLLFFVGFSKREIEVAAVTAAAAPAVETCPCLTPPVTRCEPAWCACSAGGGVAYCAFPGPSYGTVPRMHKSLSYAAPLNRSCCSTNAYPECCRRAGPLRASRSVPEGLARRGTWSRGGSCRASCRRREHQLIEQITTSV